MGRVVTRCVGGGGSSVADQLVHPSTEGASSWSQTVRWPWGCRCLLPGSVFRSGSSGGGGVLVPWILGSLVHVFLTVAVCCYTSVARLRQERRLECCRVVETTRFACLLAFGLCNFSSCPSLTFLNMLAKEKTASRMAQLTTQRLECVSHMAGTGTLCWVGCWFVVSMLFTRLNQSTPDHNWAQVCFLRGVSCVASKSKPQGEMRGGQKSC